MTNEIYGLHAEQVTYRYPKEQRPALDNLSVRIPAGKIVGLLGPNGSGKTTFMRLAAGHARPQTGRLTLTVPAFPSEASASVSETSGFELTRFPEGAGTTGNTSEIEIFENPEVVPRIHYVADKNFNLALSYQTYCQIMKLHPYFDAEMAAKLGQELKIEIHKPLKKMSWGKQALVQTVLGISYRCPVLMFDEITAGIDVPTRYRLYELIMEDYAEHPRTIIFSSHLISELETLIEHVIILKEGQLAFQGDVDEIRENAANMPLGETSALQYGFLQIVEGNKNA